MENKEWYKIFVRALECPVCLVIPESVILMCQKGHAICDFCRRKLTKCPMCNNDFLTDECRNFVAQDFASNLEKLKLCIEKEIKERSVNIISQSDQQLQTDECIVHSIHTQTNDFGTRKSSVHTQTDVLKKNCKLENTAIIPYPQCMIGFCKYNASYEKLIVHLRHFHKQHFLEGTQFSKIFPKTFLVHNNELPTHINFAFSINNTVIIFLNFIINRGSLKSCVVFISRGSSLPPLGYEAQIKSNTYQGKYYGKVNPYTILHDTENANDFCFNANKMSKIMKAESFELIFTAGTVKLNAVE